MVEPVIVVDRLSKRYSATRRGERAGRRADALRSVSFEVRPGEVFGFLGPNGAGKTTTMRIMLDLLRPTSGRVLLFGLDARESSRRIHERVGYVPGEMGGADRLRARDALRYAANLRGGVGWSAVEDLAARLDLDLDRPVRALSSGNRRKVAIVQAFMHDPALLLLDEPTSGLDPLMQQEFNRLVRERRAAGRTVFLSSHALAEVEALCDRVAIIREGRIVAVEDVAGLKARALRRARVRLRDPARAGALAGVPGVSDVRVEGEVVTCHVRGATGPLVEALAALGVLDLAIHEPTLEDVFLGYYAEAQA